MKTKILIFFLLLSLINCGANSISEVGNPTTPSTKALTSATTSALRNSTNNLTTELISTDISADPSFLTTANGFSCTFDTDTKIETCNCPNGGTLTHEFSGSFDHTGATFTFNNDVITTYTDCAITACDEDVELDGIANGTMTGTFNALTTNASLTLSSDTAADCTGMSGNNTTDYGYNLDLTREDSTTDFNGSFCIGNQTITFESLADLQSQVDSQGTCDDGFI